MCLPKEASLPHKQLLSGPEPKTMPAPPKVIDDVTIAFFAAKPSATAAGGKRFENVFYRRKRDGADAALPDVRIDGVRSKQEFTSLVIETTATVKKP